MTDRLMSRFRNTCQHCYPFRVWKYSSTLSFERRFRCSVATGNSSNNGSKVTYLILVAQKKLFHFSIHRIRPTVTSLSSTVIIIAYSLVCLSLCSRVAWLTGHTTRANTHKQTAYTNIAGTPDADLLTHCISL